MTTETQISLITFLFSPRKGMSRLNGWQRIWLVLSGVILALHVVIGSFFLPDIFKESSDQNLEMVQLADTNKWINENRKRCVGALEEVEFAQRLNEEYNAKGEAVASELRAATQVKINEAKAKLFAIETSGGKYYGEWVKFDNAIDAYTKKLNEQRWTQRPFSKEAMVKPWVLHTVQDCVVFDQQRTTLMSSIDTNKKNAENAREDARNGILITLLSFFCISLGFYLFGWCIAWIKGGFSR